MDGTNDDIHTHTESSIAPDDWTTSLHPRFTIDPRLLETSNAPILPHGSGPAQLSVGGADSQGSFQSATAGDTGVGSEVFSSSNARTFAGHQVDGSQNQMMRKRGACLKCKIQKKKVRRSPIILKYPN